jgi:hypothetical protein
MENRGLGKIFRPFRILRFSDPKSAPNCRNLTLFRGFLQFLDFGTKFSKKNLPTICGFTNQEFEESMGKFNILY